MNNDQKVQEVLDKLDGLTPTKEEMKLFVSAVHSTYSTIGSVFDEHSASIETIMEVILDADYVKSYGNLTKEQHTKFDHFVNQELKRKTAYGKEISWKAHMKFLAKVLWYRN